MPSIFNVRPFARGVVLAVFADECGAASRRPPEGAFEPVDKPAADGYRGVGLYVTVLNRVSVFGAKADEGALGVGGDGGEPEPVFDRQRDGARAVAVKPAFGARGARRKPAAQKTRAVIERRAEIAERDHADDGMMRHPAVRVRAPQRQLAGHLVRAKRRGATAGAQSSQRRTKPPAFGRGGRGPVLDADFHWGWWLVVAKVIYTRYMSIRREDLLLGEILYFHESDEHFVEALFLSVRQNPSSDIVRRACVHKLIALVEAIDAFYLGQWLAITTHIAALIWRKWFASLQFLQVFEYHLHFVIKGRVDKVTV